MVDALEAASPSGFRRVLYWRRGSDGVEPTPLSQPPLSGALAVAQPKQRPHEEQRAAAKYSAQVQRCSRGDAQFAQHGLTVAKMPAACRAPQALKIAGVLARPQNRRRLRRLCD